MQAQLRSEMEARLRAAEERAAQNSGPNLVGSLGPDAGVTAASFAARLSKLEAAAAEGSGAGGAGKQAVEALQVRGRESLHGLGPIQAGRGRGGAVMTRMLP